MSTPVNSGNPSRWAHRIPAIVLALTGCGIAAYLAAYQLGAFAHVWEPIFGDGSRTILHSSVAKLLPVPDAGLGAAGYLGEAVAGCLGGARRWRTAPWAVALYTLIVAAFAAGSLGLVLAQPLAFHAGCTLCLASAALSSAIALWVFPEPLASLRHVRRVRAGGGSLRDALLGDADDAGDATERQDGAAAHHAVRGT